MAIIGGDIIEITVSHPELGDAIFRPKANEAFTLDPGGLFGDDEENGITADGTMIRKMTTARWSLEGLVAWDMNGANELEFYRALGASILEADFTMTSLNGTVWAAKGSPVGRPSGNTMDATFTLKIAGGGRCFKIVG